MDRLEPLTIHRMEEYFGSRERFGDEGEFDALDTFHTILTRTVCDVLLDDVNTEEISRLYTDVEAGLGPVEMFLPNLPIPSNLKRKKARKQLQDLIDSTIKSRANSTNEKVNNSQCNECVEN